MPYSLRLISSRNCVAGPPHPKGGGTHLSILMEDERPANSSRNCSIAGAFLLGSAIVLLLLVFDDSPTEAFPSLRGWRVPTEQRHLATRSGIDALSVVGMHGVHILLRLGKALIIPQHVEWEMPCPFDSECVDVLRHVRLPPFSLGQSR